MHILPVGVMSVTINTVNDPSKTREAQASTPELRQRELNFSAVLQSVSQKEAKEAQGPKPREERIRDAISQSAAKYNLPPALVMAFIKQESGFNPNAVSHCGARGLMQLMPATARNLGVKDSLNIEQNVDGGCRYVREMLDRFNGNLKHAIAAYNAGPGAVEKYNGVPPYAETKNYVPAVLAHYQQFNGGAEISIPEGRPKGIDMNLAVSAVASAEMMSQSAISLVITSNVQPLQLPESKRNSDPEPPPPPPTAMRV